MACWDQNSSTRYGEAIEESPFPPYGFFAFGVLGNVLAVCAICLNRKQHQWRSFYIFFLGLAISDFLNQVSVIPFEVLRYESHFTYRISKGECKFISFSYAFTQISSGLIIAGTTTDQHIHVFRFKSRRVDPKVGSRKIYVLALCAMWTVAAFVSSIHLIIGKSEIFYPGSWCFIDVSSKDLGSSASALVYSLTGILTLIYTASLHLYIMCRSHKDPELRGHLVDTDRITGYYDIHVNIFLMTSVCMYVLCWGPFLIDILLRKVNAITVCPGRLELWLAHLVDLKSNLNPWLYVILRKENLRRIVRKFRSCRAGNIQDGEGDGENDRLFRDGLI
uniref:G-protein coupled receptors family 1 profile domain-containing protein n=1 Tax=Magallana gigas TaxID=29159 RepID=A0A8W8JEQ3_MAGGI|nr:prostaglandin E2 receptor EP4 subtype-like [Crassostrea gigas]